MEGSEDEESRTASFNKATKAQLDLINSESFIDLSAQSVDDQEIEDDHESGEEDEEFEDSSDQDSHDDDNSRHPRLSIPTSGSASIIDGPPTKMYHDLNSLHDSSEEDDEEVDDSIKLNLADEEKMDVISITDDAKNDSDDSIAITTQAEQPTGRVEKRRKANGAIPVSIGLKLGGHAKALPVSTSAPDNRAKSIEIVDHTESKSASRSTLNNSSRTSSGITSISNSAKPSREASDEDDDDTGDSDDDDDDDDDDASISSVDSSTWSRQRKYYVRGVSPDLLNAEGKPVFGAVNANIIIDDRQKICDICQGRHKTENCEVMNCSVCGAVNKHFSLNCPSLLKGFALAAGKCASCSTLNSIPKMTYCAHIWRFHPEPIHPYKKSKRIPISCYQCGMSNDHFGDECPSMGRRGIANNTSSSPWSVSEASKWSTMNLNSKYTSTSTHNSTQNGSRRDPIAVTSDDDDEGDETSWFETRLKAAKEKVPDSELSGRPMTANVVQQRPKKKPWRREEREQTRDNRDSRRMPIKDYGDDIRNAGSRREPPLRIRRRSRSPPPIQYGYPDQNRDRGYQPPPPPGVSFSMRGNQYPPPPPPRGNYRQEDRHMPPLPPGPPPGPSGGRDFYRPGGNSARQAWRQYQR